MKYLLLAAIGVVKAVEDILDKFFSGMFYAIVATFGISATIAILEKLSQ